MYLQLFLSFFQIGLWGFGGGYAILPLIQNETVFVQALLSQADFVNLVTVSQLTPGPILINSATFIGNKTGGILGGIIATIASVIPSFVIIIILSIFYYKYRNLSIVKNILNFLKPVVVGLIAAAGISIVMTAIFNNSTIALNQADFMGFILVIAAFIALRIFKKNPILIIAACGLIYMLYSLI